MTTKLSKSEYEEALRMYDRYCNMNDYPQSFEQWFNIWKPGQPIPTKEVLHTQGEWKTKRFTSGSSTLIMGLNNEIIGKTDITVSIERAEANAELICKAVNERQRLIDSNRELLEAAKAAKKMYEKVQPAGGYQGVYESLVTAINNSKNITSDKT